jgi:hypothetical protein
MCKEQETCVRKNVSDGRSIGTEDTGHMKLSENMAANGRKQALCLSVGSMCLQKMVEIKGSLHSSAYKKWGECNTKLWHEVGNVKGKRERRDSETENSRDSKIRMTDSRSCGPSDKGV